jgi:hypothetical protein
MTKFYTMKNTIILMFLLLIVGCRTTNISTTTGAFTIKNDCPAAGLCDFELLKGKSLAIKRDDFGHPYYTLLDAPGRVVGKYTYSKKRNPDYKDDFYDEEILFETDENFTDLNATDSKLIFGVKCFCRGKAGYYMVEKAEMEHKNNLLLITVPNVIEGQLTKKIAVQFD